MINLSKILFFNSIILGTFITISSYSWLSIWIGLEINLLSIIPLFKDSKNLFPSEATIKYFITQSIASTILIISILIRLILSNYFNHLNYEKFIIIILNTTFLIKIGAAPFHFWFPEIIEGLCWRNILIILTWQKIAPIIILIYNLNIITNYLNIIVITSTLIRGLQGLNQISLRKIIAYSSINHIRWIISAISYSSNVWFIYFSIYSIISFLIIFILNIYNIFYLNQLRKIFNNNKITKIIFITNFLSLGGLPPFLGFVPKWFTIKILIENNLYFIRIILILFTLVTLYIYVRLIFSTFSINKNEDILTTFKILNSKFFTLNFITLMSLLTCELIYTIY